MTAAVKLSFERETVVVPLSKLLPTKSLPKNIKSSAKYKEIEASFRVVGTIEPPVIFRQRDGNYLLLEGHKRIAVLNDAGVTEVECLVSTEDEGYSFNHWVSYLAPIQANKMIVRTLDAGVPADRLAASLNRSERTIRLSRTMLKDISEEALELLKDKPVAAAAFGLFKHVKPLRQIEMAELMNKMKTYSKSYAEGLVARTKPEDLVEPDRPKDQARQKPEELAHIEEEMQALERDILLIDESYGRDLVNLTLAQGYVKKILDNARVVKYLATKYADLLTEFQRIHEAASLEA